jgi:hypothetical protein
MKKAFVGLALSAVLLALSFPSEAQQPGKIPRIGFLTANSAAAEQLRLEPFRQGLRARSC